MGGGGVEVWNININFVVFIKKSKNLCLVKIEIFGYKIRKHYCVSYPYQSHTSV